MYGRLWSAVSFDYGFHFSGSLPSIVKPASCEAISTETISSGFSISFLASSAAQMDVCEWISAGKNFRYVSAILKDPFLPPKSLILIWKGPDTCLKKPISPSKMGDGPLMPSRASSAEKTPFRAALANEHPFHMDNSPALTCRIVM